MSILTIDRTTVFQKTAKGRAEIGQRGAGLAAAQRQILIVVDGQAPGWLACGAAIIAAPNPNQAKKLGRTVKDFDSAAWEAARLF